MLPLGVRADLLVDRLRCQLTEKPDYWLVATPSLPSYYFGNFLVLKQALTPDALPQALAMFESEFNLGHRAFAWALAEHEQVDFFGFKQRGFEAYVHQVLSADTLAAPAPLADNLSVRALTSKQDWRQALALDLLFHPEADQDTREFVQAQQVYKQQLQAADMARSFGLFKGEELVCVAMLAFDQHLAQIRDVITHTEHRRQGYCRALLTHIGQWAQQDYAVNRFVITADEDYHALSLYESLGFKRVAREAQCWRAA